MSAAEKKAAVAAEAQAKRDAADGNKVEQKVEAKDEVQKDIVITVMTQVGLMINPLTGQEIDTGDKVKIVNPDGWIQLQLDAKKLIEV